MQSGSATVLKRMRRRYDPEEYMQAVEMIRRFMPDAAITTDVIAGFPGETEEEHRETLAFVEKVGFARIHVFPYSRRSGTLADQMPDQVPEAEKHRRAQELIALGNRLEELYVQNMTGSVRDVLFERIAKDGLCEGYTGEYVRVRAVAQPNDIADVRLTRREGTLVFGDAE
jgi:threonylcarbamoyladenosine tRNA methylthiotransferase MtaB